MPGLFVFQEACLTFLRLFSGPGVTPRPRAPPVVGKSAPRNKAEGHCQRALALMKGLGSLVGVSTLGTKGRKYFKCSGVCSRDVEKRKLQK